VKSGGSQIETRGKGTTLRLQRGEGKKKKFQEKEGMRFHIKDRGEKGRTLMAVMAGGKVRRK